MIRRTTLIIPTAKSSVWLIQSILLSLSFSFSGVVNADSGNGQRWYSPQQVESGSKLYQQHCAQCHGKRAEGTADWKTPLTDGSFPPPPLDGSAHTWHHGLPLLQRTIREGGAAYDGKMPPFAHTLNADKVDAIIAWFQSLWSDEIYNRWHGDREPDLEQPAIIQEILGNLK